MQPLQTSERAASPLPLRPLIANTLAFALAFAAWVVLGPASRLIAKELGLDPGTGALVKALPILTGSLLRIPVGMLTDRLGARRVFPALLVSAGAGALFLAQASTVAQVLVGGLVLGFAGTTFVVGVQSVSAWTPRERQGLALGCFGAGRVLLRPASPGTGVIAGGGVRAVVESAGVRDVLTKTLGTSNPHNVVRATLQALEQLRAPEDRLRVLGRAS